MRAIILLLFFISGSVLGQEINQFDAQGKRHGKWKKFFKGTKKVRYSGQFEHGKEVGVFKFYHKEPIKTERWQIIPQPFQKQRAGEMRFRQHLERQFGQHPQRAPRPG